MYDAFGPKFNGEGLGLCNTLIRLRVMSTFYKVCKCVHVRELINLQSKSV